MPDIQILINEIMNDPLGRGYSGMSNQEVANQLNNRDRVSGRIATANDVRSYLITQTNGSGVNKRSTVALLQEFAELGTLRGLVPSVTPPTSLDARRSSCQMIWFVLRFSTGEGAGFPVDNVTIRDQFIAIGPDGTSGPGVLTLDQLQDIDALASEFLSRGDEIGFGFVEARDVRWARGG